MWWAVGSEPPGPLRGRSSGLPRASSLLALLSRTPLLYFTVTSSVCISFIGSQKPFSVSASELSPPPHPRPGGPPGVLVRAFPSSRSHRLIPTRQRTSGISSGRLRSQHSRGSPRQPSLFCHIGLFFLLLNRLNDRGFWWFFFFLE